MRKSLIAILPVLILSACSDIPAYKDASLPADKRATDLLSRMTLEEKIGQLICPYGWPMYEKTSDSTATYSQDYVQYIKERHGGMLWGLFRADPWTQKTLESGLHPRTAVSAYNALQHYAMDSTRLGIPIILAEEAPHGHMAIGTTVFPTGISLASTWDSDLMEEVGGVIREELTAVGARIAYGPVIDLSREPRWSRVEETYGEDVYLTSQMTGAVVRGLSPKKNGFKKGVISTLKHFVAYGVPQGGHNGGVSVLAERDLYENILPAFKAGIDEGALSVMTSYNSINGVPSTANRQLLEGVLRSEWGFEGIVVSDLVSIDGLSGTHRIASDKKEAAQMALEAGVDVDLGANCYVLLKEKIESGEISQKTLDRSVSRVLEMKFKLGLFDNPYIDEDSYKTIHNQQHTKTALQAAREGVILLKNDGILPLKKDAKVAVIGPNADRMYNQLGDYTAPQDPEGICTPLEGINEKIGPSNVFYAKGCAIKDTESADITSAVRTVEKADVAVVFVGGSSARDFETQFSATGAAVDGSHVSDMESGEGFDRASLKLLGVQEELLKAVKATGKPLVVVYIEGRPLDKRWASEHADALLTQFYPGQAGGYAIADVLFGDYNPAGRLPLSVPYDVGQLPVYYNQPYGSDGDYMDMTARPLYSFGYGLSYTSFSYESIQCEPLGGGKVKVSVNVSNTGLKDGDEVIQIYVTDKIASTVRPRLQLRGFRRVHFKAGESKRVEFELDRDAFSLYNLDMEKVLEKGAFIIQAGPSSDDIKLSEEIILD